MKNSKARNIVIKCPSTGKSVPTGFAAEKEAFESPTFKVVNLRVACPHCGEAHAWTKEDASLE